MIRDPRLRTDRASAKRQELTIDPVTITWLVLPPDR